MLFEDSQFYEKLRKETEDARVESSYKFASLMHSNLDDYHHRKSAFFLKMLSSMAEYRLKYPSLSKQFILFRLLFESSSREILTRTVDARLIQWT